MRFFTSYIFSIFLFLSLCRFSSGENLADDLKRESSSTAIGTSCFDNKFSLLEPSRFSMQHSYSIAYSSVNGYGQTIGLYMNSMKYSFANSLNLNVTIGWVHRPSSVFSRNNRGVTDYGRILPNVQLLYQPSDKFRFEINYESIPGVYSNSKYNAYTPFFRRPY